MADVQQTVLDTISRARRARSVPNPFQEVAVRFATAAATVVESQNVAMEAENIHLRTELLSTFVDFLSKQVSEVCGLRQGGSQGKRRRSGRCDGHGDDNEEDDSEAGAGAGGRGGADSDAVRAGVAAASLVRELPDGQTLALPAFVGADLARSALRAQRPPAKRHHTALGGGAAAADDDEASALGALRAEQARLFALRVTPSNFLDVVGDLLWSVGIQPPGLEPVPVAALKALQRRILPFDAGACTTTAAAALESVATAHPTSSAPSGGVHATGDVSSVEPGAGLGAGDATAAGADGDDDDGDEHFDFGDLDIGFDDDDAGDALYHGATLSHGVNAAAASHRKWKLPLSDNDDGDDQKPGDQSSADDILSDSDSDAGHGAAGVAVPARRLAPGERHHAAEALLLQASDHPSHARQGQHQQQRPPALAVAFVGARGPDVISMARMRRSVQAALTAEAAQRTKKQPRGAGTAFKRRPLFDYDVPTPMAGPVADAPRSAAAFAKVFFNALPKAVQQTVSAFRSKFGLNLPGHDDGSPHLHHDNSGGGGDHADGGDGHDHHDRRQRPMSFSDDEFAGGGGGNTHGTPADCSELDADDSRFDYDATCDGDRTHRSDDPRVDQSEHELYRLLDDTDLAGALRDDAAVAAQVQQQLSRVEDQVEERRRFDYQPVSKFEHGVAIGPGGRPGHPSSVPPASLTQIMQVLEELRKHHPQFTSTWWLVPEQRALVTNKVAAWAAARGLRVTDATVFAALTYFSHQQKTD